MTYYLKALSLIAQGGRYGSTGLLNTLLVVALRQCRLHWLRQPVTLSARRTKQGFGTLAGER